MREKIVVLRSKLNSVMGAAKIGDRESVQRHVAEALESCDMLYDDAKAVTGEAALMLDALAACDHYRERARRCRAEGLVDDDKLCLRMAREHLQAAMAPFDRRNQAICDDGLSADDLPMRQVVAENSDRLKAWLDFESGYWDARAGRPISRGVRPYNLGYRHGQAVNKKMKS